MLFDDTYYTIEKPVEGTFRDRGSKFMAYAYPINNDNEIKGILSGLKTQHPKANHHCWAVRIGTDRSVFRINDDGEPSGTAGRQILNVLLSHNITNIVVIVVRYFGGTLLGVPGLINAYRSATEDALNHAIINQKTENDTYTIEFIYLQVNDVMKILKDENVSVLIQTLENRCSIQFSIRKTCVNQTLAKLNKIDAITIRFDFSS